MEDHSKQGVFNWNELLTTDPAGARNFYSQVFGWQMEDMEMPGGNYTVFKEDGDQVGGMMELPEQARQMGAPPYWNAYVSVDDIDATVRKVEELGGKVLVPPMDITDIGRFATFQDPQGAVISALQPVR